MSGELEKAGRFLHVCSSFPLSKPECVNCHKKVRGYEVRYKFLDLKYGNCALKALRGFPGDSGAPGPRRKEQLPYRLACGCLGVSGKGMGWWWPATGLGAWTVAVHAWDL